MIGFAMVVACGKATAQPPDELLASAAQALRSAESYHVTGMLDPGLAVDVVVVPGGSSGTVTTHGVTFDEVAQNGALWLRGRVLWNATLPGDDANRLGDQWVRVSAPDAAFGLTDLLSHLDQSVPGVVFAPQPKLVNRGSKDLDGVRVIELTNATDTYDISADGRSYPVRWLDVDTPGANGQPCGITLHDFDAATTVSPPPTWIAGP